MTLWDKGYGTEEAILSYTVGEDPELDMELLPYDIEASLAHAKMLEKIGILDAEEHAEIAVALGKIKELHAEGKFSIAEGQEDMHTAIEEFLTEKLGDVGKKIHTARSRNDQVLAALRLYEKEKLKEMKDALLATKDALKTKQSKTMLPGYTHTRKAMPMSVETWLGSFMAGIDDAQVMLEAVGKVIDKNPLGTGAGFGIPYPIDQQVTEKALGFASSMANPLSAQASRGKYELMILQLCSQIMLDENKLASDLILFTLPELGYVKLPGECTTGSSIMPQKENPDVLELVRANYHVVAGQQAIVSGICADLISGYHRDLQLTKGPLLKGLKVTLDTLKVMAFVVSKMAVDEASCKKALTPELYATEEAYKLVKMGMPFRDAYKEIGKKYAKGGKGE